MTNEEHQFFKEIDNKIETGKILTFGQLYEELGFDKFNISERAYETLLPGVKMPIPKEFIYMGHRYVLKDES